MNGARMIEHEIELSIPFHDVDLMQVTWHGHYVRYLEVARSALLDKIGYGYKAMMASGYAWPVIDMHIRYPRSCSFGDRIRVRARIVESELRLKIDYLITMAETGERLTKASTVQVAVNMDNGEMCYPTPAELQDRIRVAAA